MPPIHLFNASAAHQSMNPMDYINIQIFLYYAASRLWAILHAISNADSDRQTWTQKLLHRELVWRKSAQYNSITKPINSFSFSPMSGLAMLSAIVSPFPSSSGPWRTALPCYRSRTSRCRSIFPCSWPSISARTKEGTGARSLTSIICHGGPAGSQGISLPSKYSTGRRSKHVWTITRGRYRWLAQTPQPPVNTPIPVTPANTGAATILGPVNTPIPVTPANTGAATIPGPVSTGHPPDALTTAAWSAMSFKTSLNSTHSQTRWPPPPRHNGTSTCAGRQRSTSFMRLRS
jgi:hypothetical protein